MFDPGRQTSYHRALSETWPRGRRHSPAKGAYGLKPVSRVRIPPSPPVSLKGCISKSKQRLAEYGLFLIYPFHLPLVALLPFVGVSGGLDDVRSNLFRPVAKGFF